MDVRILLHPGPHKTATTSLQESLRTTFPAPRHGEPWYPPPPQGTGPGHALLCSELLGIFGKKRCQDRLAPILDEAEAAGVDPLILSAEDFAWAVPRQIDELTASFTGHQVDLLFTLTPFGRRAVSWWMESLFHGSTDDLETALPSILSGPGFAPDFIPALCRAFPGGRHCLIVVHPGGDPRALPREFSRATGLPPLGPDGGTPALTLNPSTGVLEAEAVLAMNRFLGKEVAQGASPAASPSWRRILRDFFSRPAWKAHAPVVPARFPEASLPLLEDITRGFLAAVADARDRGVLTVHGELASLDDGAGMRSGPKAAREPPSGE